MIQTYPSDKVSAKFLPVLIAAFFILLSGISVFAQQAATATIEGVATDQAGAVVPNVKVTATNIDTGFTRETTTDESGVYRLPLLPPGNYKITAKATGFGDTNFNNITLTVGQKLNLDVPLSVTVGETVNITDVAPVVETSRTSISSAVNSRAVSNLPVNGRNFLDFVTLTPGVVRDPRGGDLSFGGQRGTLNSIQIDGVDNNNNFFGQALGRTGSGRAPYQFSQDAVQEFQVNTNSYSAEFGRAAGGAINVITKSGTNNFHGTGFEFYRDRALNANSLVFDATRGTNGAMVPNFGFLLDSSGNRVRIETKPSYHFHQFGGNIGGPIKTDRAFFFFNYDGQRNTQPNIISLGATAPTDTASQAGLTKLLPYTNNYTRGFNQDVYLGKVDLQLDSANRLGFRYNRQNFTGRNLENSSSTGAQEHSGNSLVTTDTLTITLNTVFTPRLLNEFRTQVARDREPGFANTDNPEATIQQGGRTVLVIGRNNFSPRETTERKYQFIDNITYIAGKHSLKGGVDFNIEKIKNFFPGFFGAGYTFSSYANFANNVVASYTQAFAGDGTSGPTTFPNFNEYSAFLQDDWRPTTRLTLNLGVRYDVQQMAQPSAKNPALAAVGIDTSRANNDYNNFSPRIGLAYRPTDSDRFVVRAGYGLFYGRTPSIALGTAHSNNGLNVINITLNNPTGLIYPFRFASLAEIQARGGAAATPSVFVFDRNYQQPYTQQASLNVEYGLTKDLAFSASYLSVKGRHLQRTRDINLPTPVLTTLPITNGGTASFLRYPGAQGAPTRPTAGFGRISQFESSASSNYNALALQLIKRFSHHFDASIAYTFSKVIDDTPDATSVVTANAGDDAKQAQQSFNLRDDRGPGVANVPHRLVASGTWNLDYFNSLPGAAQFIIGGWQVSGIYQLATNRPFSAQLGRFDLNNDSNRDSDRAPGFGRNTFHKGNFSSFDFRTTKKFRITEQARVEFIAEFFNLFNRVNFTGWNTQLYTVNTTGTAASSLTQRTDFGDPRNAADPRIGQLALKFIF